MKHPQEIEVWYVLPAIRREIAKSLVNDCKLSQKEVAKILEVTESAVSQYLKSKRAKEVYFNSEIKKKIKEMSQKLIKDKSLLLKDMQNICRIFRKSNLLCTVHRMHDKVPVNCTACSE